MAKFPDYLSADLENRGNGAFPLLGACDDLTDRFSHLALLGLFDLVSESSSVHRQRRLLEGIGFKTRSLSEEDVMRLYDSRTAILQNVGRARSVEQLAEIYFPGAKVDQGLPFGTSRVGAGKRLRLGDRKQHQTLFVRLVGKVDEARIAEFRGNAKGLVPVHHQVIVADPLVPLIKSPRADLGKPRSWEKRRLECLISHK